MVLLVIEHSQKKKGTHLTHIWHKHEKIPIDQGHKYQLYNTNNSGWKQNLCKLRFGDEFIHMTARHLKMLLEKDIVKGMKKQAED